MDKLIIYGMGRRFEQLQYSYFYKNEYADVVAYSDKKIMKQSIDVTGIPVVPPEEINNFEFDKIIVTLEYYFEEVFNELTNKFNILPIKILPLEQYFHMSYLKLVTAAQFDLPDFEKNVHALPMPKKSLENCRVLNSRHEALLYMPKNAIVSEVGVAYGQFSEKILERMKPKKFYAIDYYSQETPFKDFWEFNYFRLDNMPHQEWYEHKFKNQIEAGLMEIRQGLSWNCLEAFPDNYFDYVYLDAAHDYDSVNKDIAVLQRKVKNGGYIQFNDYTNISLKDMLCYGVVPAVNEFVNINKHSVVFLCIEPNGYNDIVVQLNK